ncbi:hypothetical protein Vadar_015700 [Vaccinium darrowii]|uniref:Uncharacterized protein n=1 Tax=Vaccinium darrowii TaxID=229202 RepID=A0ACB7XA16_9ERIC|nr:hypothetical protein Vadar_015700 [Vaccinium darrowii]
MEHNPEERASMAHSLCEAAITGNIDLLHQIISKDKLILHRIASGCFNGTTSPLHVATSNKKLHFVEKLLRLAPKLAEVLDVQLRSALPLASAKWYGNIVKVLVKVNPEMRLVRDRDGLIFSPGVQRSDLFINQPTSGSSQGGSERAILHWCVKHNQLKSLKIRLKKIQGDKELVNAKDNDGKTLLHLAILDKRFEGHDEIVKVLAKANPKICLVRDREGKNPLHVAAVKGKTSILEELVQTSLQATRDRAARNETILHLCVKHNQLESLETLLDSIQCWLASVRPTQVNPTGHVWQETTDKHRAGEAVIAYIYQDSYPYFLKFNTVGFVASMSMILFLISGLKLKNKLTMWILIVGVWLAITSMTITYEYSNVVVTPEKDRRSLSHTIKVAIIVWFRLMGLIPVKHTVDLVEIFVEEKMSRVKARIIKRIKQLPRRLLGCLLPLCKLLGVRDGGGTSPLHSSV